MSVNAYTTDAIQDPDIVAAVEAVDVVLPKRLIGFREAQGLLVKDVAEEIGVTPQEVSAYECGRRIPSVKKLVAFAAFYGVSVDELIWEGV